MAKDNGLIDSILAPSNFFVAQLYSYPSKTKSDSMSHSILKYSAATTFKCSPKLPPAGAQETFHCQCLQISQIFPACFPLSKVLLMVLHLSLHAHTFTSSSS